MAVIGGTAITWLAAGLLRRAAGHRGGAAGALPPLSLPDLRQVPNLVLLALVMTLLAVTEAMAIAKVRAARQRAFDGNQELVGQGWPT